MANAKEIKDRMFSVRDTQKITNAMYLISSTKLQRAKRELDNTRPFFDSMQDEIKRIFSVGEEIENRYFYPAGTDDSHSGRYGILVITADRGMAGAYNHNIIKETERLISEHPDYELYVIGEYGRHYFTGHGCNVQEEFSYANQTPTMYKAREIRDILLERYNSGAIDKIYIVYTDQGRAGENEAKSVRLLPFHRRSFYAGKTQKAETDFEYYPSAKVVLDNVMPVYIGGFIYSAITASFCCEQSARMNAMDSANRNAEKLIKELKIQYNRVRQAAITQEITEVSAGAKAQKKKREKRRKCLQEESLK